MKFKNIHSILLIALIVLTACNNPAKSDIDKNTTGNIKSRETKKDYKVDSFTVLQYCKTVKELNNVVLENNFPPMIASRNYAYASIAGYEVVAALDTVNYKSLAGQIKHLPKLSYPTAQNVHTQLAAMLAFCKVGQAVTFPEGSMKDYVNALLAAAPKNGLDKEALKATQLFADSIANQILAWSKKDKYAALRTATKYNVTEEENRWKPTPPMYAQAVEPHWMEIRPLILDSASECKPQRPPAYDMKNRNSPYYKLVNEVRNINASLTEEQKTIAFFWDDNPFKMNVIGHVMYAEKKFSPPGHWMNLIGIAAQKTNTNFPKTVAAYAHTSIALFDGFISCWDEKYRSNAVRPQTVINKYFQPDWEPLIQTPPFPSYTSGHATISAASAQILTQYFGDNLSFSDTSLVEFGIKPRTIISFKKAAAEAALSRLYGGIHFRTDNEAGASSGKKIGELVLSRVKLVR